MAMDWDYDVALLQQKNDKIKWVLPAEGVHAYLEGFTAVQDTSKIDVIQAFLNFLAEPAQYADFVNTTGTAYMMPAATPLIKKTISKNPILVPTPEVLAKTEFDKYLGPDGSTLWTNTWEAVRTRRSRRAHPGAASSHAEGAALRFEPPGPLGPAAADDRDHGGVLPRAAGADRAVLVRLDQPGQLRRLLRLDDPELPGLHVVAVRAHAAAQRGPVGLDHAGRARCSASPSPTSSAASRRRPSGCCWWP